jgi:tryptophan synthase alpha chain
MDRIATTFAESRRTGRARFVAYLCAGDPDAATSLALARAAIAAGTDLLELGVPFSDPLADGLTNQLAAQRALAAGATQESAFELVEAIRRESDIPIVFYTYYNLIHARGLDAYVERAKAAGVDGLLTLDLPPEEAGPLREACAKVGLRTVFIVAPTTPPARIAKIAAAADGFLYYVSRTGVTGEQSTLAADLGEALGRIRAATDLPVVVGFGISHPDHVRTVAKVADGVVVGSALVNVIPAHLDGDRAAMAPAMAAKVRWLREGLA